MSVGGWEWSSILWVGEQEGLLEMPRWVDGRTGRYLN